jgi:hypothetical protein
MEAVSPVTIPIVILWHNPFGIFLQVGLVILGGVTAYVNILFVP